MTLTETFVPYNHQPKYDAQIAALDWDMVPPPDAMQQESPLSDLVFTMRELLTDRGSRKEVFVSSNTFLCYDPTNLNRRLQPDLYVAFGVDETAIRARDAGYLIWEIGKQPDFVLEMASPSTARNDLTRKRDIYAQIGIPEYWRFDATGGEYYGDPLVGEKLVEGTYQPLPITFEPDGHPKGFSPILGLTLAWDHGVFRVFDPEDNEYSKTARESLSVLDAEVIARRAAEERVRQLEQQLQNLRSSRNGDPV